MHSIKDIKATYYRWPVDLHPILALVPSSYPTDAEKADLEDSG